MWDLRVDGDALIFKAGFAADSRGGGVAHSLHNAKLIINMLTTKFYPCRAKILIGNMDRSVNWRYKLFPEYKANRAVICSKCKNPKLTHVGVKRNEETGAIFRGFKCDSCEHIEKDKQPVYYYELRKYLLKRFNTTVAKWGETDDWLGVNRTHKTIIASHDKDLLMVPAFHWRLHQDLGFKTTDIGILELNEQRKLKGYGFIWFCAQMLLGDTIDNIPKPKKGFGDVAIYEYLGQLRDTATAVALWALVKDFYRQQNIPHDIMMIIAKLLWVAREPKKLFEEEFVERIDRGDL